MNNWQKIAGEIVVGGMPSHASADRKRSFFIYSLALVWCMWAFLNIFVDASGILAVIQFLAFPAIFIWLLADALESKWLWFMAALLQVHTVIGAFFLRMLALELSGRWVKRKQKGKQHQLVHPELDLDYLSKGEKDDEQDPLHVVDQKHSLLKP